MSQHLIIRLPGDTQAPVHWQLWPVDTASDKVSENSGTLSSTLQLKELAEQFPDTRAIALIPADLVSLHSLPVAGRLNKALEKSLPFRLEDDLAEDVEDLHFAILENSNDQVHIAVTAREKMNFWQQSMAASGLKCRKWIPEPLALPWSEGENAALQIDDLWIIRHGAWQWTSCDPEWLEFSVESLTGEQDTLELISYSQIEENLPGDWHFESAGTPLQVLAAGALESKANLLQGEWKVESTINKNLKPWGLAACLLAVTFGLFAAQSVQETRRLEQQAAALQVEARKIYSDLYPEERIVRLQSQMRQKLQALQVKDETEAGLLSLMNQASPLFKEFPSLKAESLSYNQSHKSLRVEATADSFEVFTNFREASGEELTIQLESLVQSEEDVQGTLTIRGVES